MNFLEKKQFQGLALLLMIVLIIFVVVLTFNIGKTPQEKETISISGTGEIFAKPDIASINLTVKTTNQDLNQSIEENSIATNKIMDYLKSQGIEDSDIKTTSYNIYPRYEYREGYYGDRYLAGYDVTQVNNVKIRDLTQIGEIISGATENGANDVSGLIFTIDDDKALRETARAIAIQNAKEDAESLEKELGVKFVRIVNFYENSNSPSPVYYESNFAKMDSASVAPSIQTGENKISSNVVIEYEIAK